jgi:eukaryotic-like serine/threonine-protein kinase
MLSALHRFSEARNSFQKAYAIWNREFGVDNVNLGYALTGIGMSYVAEGRSRDALAPLERAYAIRETREPETSRFAETGFALARALWESRHDRSRARTLAERARDKYAKLSEKNKLAEVNDWLRDHGAS